LAPTVGIAATGFCYPGGILQIFLSTRSANFFYIIKIFNASPSKIVEFIQIDGPRDESRKSIRMKHRFNDSSDQNISSKAIRRNTSPRPTRPLQTYSGTRPKQALMDQDFQRATQREKIILHHVKAKQRDKQLQIGALV
jgi:hypothetical protein